MRKIYHMGKILKSNTRHTFISHQNPWKDPMKSLLIPQKLTKYQNFKSISVLISKNEVRKKNQIFSIGMWYDCRCFDVIVSKPYPYDLELLIEKKNHWHKK